MSLLRLILSALMYMACCVQVSGEGGEYDVCGGMQCISYATSACVRVVSSRGANLSMRS